MAVVAELHPRKYFTQEQTLAQVLSKKQAEVRVGERVDQNLVQPWDFFTHFDCQHGKNRLNVPQCVT